MSFFIYHERQSSESALCGLHCLNTLLQRPAFKEFDLAKLAKELDDDERQIMAQLGDTKDYRKFLKEDSSNVADDGNFSVQVLQSALQKRNLECVRLTNANYYSVVCDLSLENAFICNRGKHWFAIRKVLPGEWYNFNSMLDAPHHMPESHLASYLDDLFDKEDVCIYTVKGSLPSASPANRPASEVGRWLVATGSNAEEFELKVAIQLSKSTAGFVDASSGDSEISYPKLPDFKNVNEKISYPTLDHVQEEQPLAFKSRSVVLPTINTQDLSVPEHIRLMSDYFGRCLNMMEKMEQRLAAVETAFTKISKLNV